MNGIRWALLGLALVSLLSACGEQSPIVDAPLPAESTREDTPPETLHLDFAWGTALLSQLEGAPDGGEGKDLTVRVQSPGRAADGEFAALAPYVTRTFAIRRLDSPGGLGVSFQIRDEMGRMQYEMGVRTGADGDVLYERSGQERLEIYRSVLPDGRRQERYRFDDGATRHDATWIEGESPDERFSALGTAAAGLASSAEARLLSSLLSDSRFTSWLVESSRANVDAAQAQFVPLEVEQACDMIDECRRAICETNPGHPLCIGCTAGSLVCALIYILF